MKIIEIVDDVGDEFSVTNIPIPFYIRCKLEEGLVRYRVRLLDETGKSRGYYIGATERDYLELHVPVIPLPEGKLFIEIELKDKDFNEIGVHKTYIEYVDQKTYDSIVKPKEKTESVPSKELVEIKSKKIETKANFELSSDELNYLTQRPGILKVDKGTEEQQRIKELSEIRHKEEE